MTKYHISKAGNVAVCRATKGPCRAQPPPDLEQFHSEDDREVYTHMSRQYGDIYQGVKKKNFSKDFTVTEALIGNEATDMERITLKKEKKSYGIGPKVKSSELWFHDTEGRPMGYIKVMEYGERPDEVNLCDVEIRPEYRGRKLSHRFINATAKKLGKKMVHEGSYTSAGVKAIAPLFGRTDEKASFNDMTFVADWDRGWGKWDL